jgi:hypothetical protein
MAVGGVSIIAILVGGGFLVAAAGSYIATTGGLGALLTSCVNSPVTAAIVVALIKSKTGIDVPREKTSDFLKALA